MLISSIMSYNFCGKYRLRANRRIRQRDIQQGHAEILFSLNCISENLDPCVAETTRGDLYICSHIFFSKMSLVFYLKSIL